MIDRQEKKILNLKQYVDQKQKSEFFEKDELKEKHLYQKNLIPEWKTKTNKQTNLTFIWLGFFQTDRCKLKNKI